MKNKNLLFAFCLTLSSVLFGYVGSNLSSFLFLLFPASTVHKSQIITMYTTAIVFIPFFAVFFFKASNKNYYKFTRKALWILFYSYLALLIYAIIPIKKSSFVLLQTPNLLQILSSTLLPFILWSYLNQIYTFKKAIKDYFLIIFSYLIFIQVISIINSNLSNINRLYTFSILGFIFLGVAIYTLSKTKPISDESTAQKPLVKKFSYTFLLKTSLLLAIPTVVTKFIMLIFKYDVKTTFPTAMEYSSFLGNFAKTSVFFHIPFSLFCIFITYYLLKTCSLKKIISYFCTLIIWLCITSIVFMMITNTVNIFPVIAIQTSLLNIKFYVFFPLIQLLFLTINESFRYKAKICTEIIFLKPLLIAKSLIPQFLIIMLGGFTQQMQLSMYIISIMLIFSLFFLWNNRYAKNLQIAVMERNKTLKERNKK